MKSREGMFMLILSIRMGKILKVYKTKVRASDPLLVDLYRAIVLSLA